jgi:hypothetical protein
MLRGAYNLLSHMSGFFAASARGHLERDWTSGPARAPTVSQLLVVPMQIWAPLWRDYQFDCAETVDFAGRR